MVCGPGAGGDGLGGGVGEQSCERIAELRVAAHVHRRGRLDHARERGAPRVASALERAELLVCGWHGNQV